MGLISDFLATIEKGAISAVTNMNANATATVECGAFKDTCKVMAEATGIEAGAFEDAINAVTNMTGIEDGGLKDAIKVVTEVKSNAVGVEAKAFTDAIKVIAKSNVNAQGIAADAFRNAVNLLAKSEVQGIAPDAFKNAVQFVGVAPGGITLNVDTGGLLMVVLTFAVIVFLRLDALAVIFSPMILTLSNTSWLPAFSIGTTSFTCGYGLSYVSKQQAIALEKEKFIKEAEKNEINRKQNIEANLKDMKMELDQQKNRNEGLCQNLEQLQVAQGKKLQDEESLHKKEIDMLKQIIMCQNSEIGKLQDTQKEELQEKQYLKDISKGKDVEITTLKSTIQSLIDQIEKLKNQFQTSTQTIKELKAALEKQTAEKQKMEDRAKCLSKLLQ
ncbi:hypothetical protein HDV02_004611 [Globomyces sp. JEL0801]|nr:hypothetical protein HDV02_004611 [Globomyces sp. JEL0801]